MWSTMGFVLLVADFFLLQAEKLNIISDALSPSLSDFAWFRDM
jgi:hypothetical protein